MLIFPTVIFII